MANIWLAQYLCPSRHALCAMPYEPRKIAAATVETRLRAEMTRLGINPWCGLCGSRDLHFEHGKMKVTNWSDAWRLLMEVERENIASRVHLDSLRKRNN